MTKISPKHIAEAIYSATEGKSSGELAQVLKRSAQVLQNKRMLGQAEDVLGVLQDIFDKKTGTIRMKVITAKSLTGGERKKLEQEVQEKYKAQHVVSEFFEKPELLGGMRVEVGDEILDATYRNQLHRLEKFLIKQV
ncbi:MAG: F0F1 ATP synthase subunit delta [Candidatus Paceibacterota bacterium]